MSTRLTNHPSMLPSAEIPMLDADASRKLFENYDVGPRDGDGRLAVVAMSGGVDSAVTALLLRERGYRVVGINMRLYTPPEGEEYPNPCCAPEALEDARMAARRIGVPFYPINLEREFEETVITYFVDEYAAGRTPNPCLECNREVKFRHLIDRARKLGADYLATGHYARVTRDADGVYHLREAVDAAKDQSYVLYAMSQEQLAFLMFPLGGLTKPEVREIAALFGLDVAGKPDSQETCFVGKGAYAEFVMSRRPGLDKPGPIVLTDGTVVGEHDGLIGYTVGQRRGLGVAYSEPLYVLSLDTAANRLVVGTRDELSFSSLIARRASLTSGVWPDEPFEAEARVRYQGKRYAAVVEPLEPGTLRVNFAERPRAVAPGQAVVLYRGDEVLGGGTIEAGETVVPLRLEAS
ncbi:MAG TPA: tRNA 2-thiouridine(34) synthase MnmA [Thermomicrobiales bacterium]|nr:tRNA 2-thiouridine(34) synthase MnmA [Thermomicrobiales bacterium]